MKKHKLPGDCLTLQSPGVIMGKPKKHNNVKY